MNDELRNGLFGTIFTLRPTVESVVRDTFQHLMEVMLRHSFVRILATGDFNSMAHHSTL